MTMFAEKAKLQFPEAVQWTRDDCDAFEKAGVLNYRYELIEGVIYKMSQNYRHGDIIMQVIVWTSTFTRSSVPRRPNLLVSCPTIRGQGWAGIAFQSILSTLPGKRASTDCILASSSWRAR